MKKQELVHLHGLLAEVRSHYEQVQGTEVDDEQYRELGVRPTSIHKSKTDHKAAVMALSDAITTEMDEETDLEDTMSAHNSEISPAEAYELLEELSPDNNNPFASVELTGDLLEKPGMGDAIDALEEQRSITYAGSDYKEGTMIHLRKVPEGYGSTS